MIKSLQSLRFLFAVMIFLHHYVGPVSIFLPMGPCGVSFFLMLSGMVMSYAYWDKVLSPDFKYGSSLKRRIIRLYPLHLLCLLMAIAWHVKDVNTEYIMCTIPSFFLVQSWIPVKEVYFGGNALAWCLCDLMFFYAIFPMMVRFLNNLKNKNGLGIFVASLLIIYVALTLLTPDSWIHPILYINPLIRSVDFIIGMLAYLLYKRIGSNLSELNFYKRTGLEMISILVVITICLASACTELRYFASAIFVIPMFFTLVTFTSFNTKWGGVTMLLNNKVLQTLGACSFDFYMCHTIIIMICSKIFRIIGIDSHFIKLPITLLITIIASMMLYYYFEQPINKKLKERIKI